MRRPRPLAWLRAKVRGPVDGSKPCGCEWAAKSEATLPVDPEALPIEEAMETMPEGGVTKPPNSRHVDTIDRVLTNEREACTEHLHLNVNVWRCTECGRRFEYAKQPIGETVEWEDGTVTRTGMVEMLHAMGHPDAPEVRDRGR